MKPHKQGIMNRKQYTNKHNRKRISRSSLPEEDSSDSSEQLNGNTSKRLKTYDASSEDEFAPISLEAMELEKSNKPLNGVNDMRKLQLLQANKEEDHAINRLEKVLGMKKQRKNEKRSTRKIPSVFAKDGLDYILEVFDKPDDNDSEDHCSAELSEMSHEDNATCDKNGEESFELNSDTNTLSDENLEEPTDYDVDVKKHKKKKLKPAIWEDIYGRLRDEKGNVLPNPTTTSQVYVPPHERLKLEPINDTRKANCERIKRQLKGLINRLSESNLNRISNEIEGMYMKNSRNDMNETLLSILSEVLLLPVSVPPRFAVEQAMLIALLHGNIGSEIGAFFLQSLTLKLDEFLKNGRNCVQGKESNNLLTFLCHLYNFKVTHSLLMFDILRLLVESFQETDMELILLILKHAGFTLRKDDPLAFKEMLQSVQSKATALKSGQNESRINYMSDILIEARSNNMEKMKRLLNYDPSITEHAKKVVRGHVRKGSYIQELSISYDDLLKAHERGRWWIVGSAWSERASENVTDVKNDSVSVSGSVSDKIFKLAKKLHLNTEARKIVFNTIMGARDYMDAFESLLRLKLRNKQEKEIISVLLHCSLHEKEFNPYYAHLATKFCRYDRRFQGYLKFSLWDKLKELESIKSCQRNHLVSLLVHLFATESLDISVLKVLHFSEMNKTRIQFFSKILTAILLHQPEEVCCNIFQRIASNSNMHLLRESLRIFMRHFILRKKLTDDSLSEKLAQRIKIAEGALNSAKHAFKL